LRQGGYETPGDQDERQKEVSHHLFCWTG
jgi:hypothetical protein